MSLLLVVAAWRKPSETISSDGLLLAAVRSARTNQLLQPLDGVSKLPGPLTPTLSRTGEREVLKHRRSDPDAQSVRVAAPH
jgi:hypothetical protein